MKYLTTMLLSFVASHVYAQEVQSKSYQKMLNRLLSHSVPELAVADVDAANKVVWLDAREKNEFEVSQIEAAQWVGYDDFSLERVSHLAKDQEIIVYCSVGYRSEIVAEKLIDSGFTNVHNLYGGIFEWKNQGKEVVDSLNAETERVHAYDRIWGVWLKEGEKVYR